MKAQTTALLSALVLLGGGMAVAQPVTSHCADCHFADRDAAERRHLTDWEHSAHGRADVGCETCHGGNPATFEPFLAHQGMLGSGNPASPVHPMNLPKTCGSCHPGPFAAFQQSRHYELLREGNRDAPTCVTCHGEVAARLLSPKGLAAECARCHGESKVAGPSDLPKESASLLTSARELRETLAHAREFIKRVADPVRRTELQEDLEAAEVPIRDAVRSAHLFVFTPMRERLRIARERIDFLLEDLANAPARPDARK